MLDSSPSPTTVARSSKSLPNRAPTGPSPKQQSDTYGRSLRTSRSPVVSPSSPRTSASHLTREKPATAQTEPARTKDASTQYTPPDWPPTSSRSSIRANKIPKQRTVEEAAKPPGSGTFKIPLQNPNLAEKESPPTVPPEPRLRVTPQSSLQHDLHRAERRPASSDGQNEDEHGEQSQPSKRHRKLEQSKIVPLDYTKCDPHDLALLIADLLMDLIRHNDEIPLKDGHLTRFHSRSPPGISVRDYLKRLVLHATLAGPVLLSMVCYIDKLCASFPDFTINSLTVHRFLIAAATVAAKGLCDVFWTNDTYAKVGGVSVRELFLLELELLTRIEWRIVPSPDGLVEYYKNLVGRSKEYEFESSSSASGESISSGDSEVA
ncbi:MAG: hypothetical protein M1831_007030 [Alyxoria varia]|nr:MAG: hypothetical protein M1831_007030 [Alyxoria varia]